MLQLYKNIKTLREQQGLSQNELARRVGYTSRTTIAKIESGKIDLPQSKIKAFAQALGTTPSDLMGWDSAKRREDMNNHFGAKLKFLREQHGLSQQELGQRVGVSRSAISMYEQNEREAPFEVIQALSTALETEISYLLADDPIYKAAYATAERAIKDELSGGNLHSGIDKGGFLSEAEREIIEKYRALNPDNQRKAYEYIRDLSAFQRVDEERQYYGYVAAYEGGYHPAIRLPEETIQKIKEDKEK